MNNSSETQYMVESTPSKPNMSEDIIGLNSLARELFEAIQEDVLDVKLTPGATMKHKARVAGVDPADFSRMFSPDADGRRERNHLIKFLNQLARYNQAFPSLAMILAEQTGRICVHPEQMKHEWIDRLNRREQELQEQLETVRRQKQAIGG